MFSSAIPRCNGYIGVSYQLPAGKPLLVGESDWAVRLMLLCFQRRHLCVMVTNYLEEVVA